MNNVSEVRLRFYPMLLGLWLILIVFILNFIGTINIFFNLLLVVCTSILSVTKPFRYSSGISGIFSALIFGLFEFQTQGWTGKAAIETGIFAVLILLTAYLCSLTGQIISQTINQLSQYRTMIDGTDLFDPATRLLKLIYAKQRLNTEILRGQRYQRDFCLMIMQPVDTVDADIKMFKVDREAVIVKLVNAIKPTLRAVDVVFIGDTVGVILPETKPQGSTIVAERIITVARNNEITLFIGISHFPSDAATVEDMLRAEETTVQAAQKNHQPIAFYSQVRISIEESNGTSNFPRND